MGYCKNHMGGRGHIHDGLRYPIMHLCVNGARKECTILAPFLCQFWVSHHGSVSWELKKGVPFYPLFCQFWVSHHAFLCHWSSKECTILPLSVTSLFSHHAFVLGAQKGCIIIPPFLRLFGFPIMHLFAMGT